MDLATVEKIAKLARIRFKDDEKQSLVKELGGIMQWIEQLSQVNTDGVEPLASVVDTSLPLRKDVVNDGENPEPVLANAPAKEHNCFAVPKVIE
ncbi:Asp-tRNA(Asn)/Glu-tRNA(Gln) amidotransferase subunit GatC [bacterium]|nr:Asp-tRNA(Asn)/Glu-tRNA(Gln) amidotransferase subunit GatC [bacterium]